MFIFYIVFLLVIAYVFALKAAAKIVSWLPWLLLAVFVLSILDFVIDHWIISIIIIIGALSIFGMTIDTEEDGKTIKPEPEGLKFYQRKVFKGWVGFIVFFAVMVGLANGPFAKHSNRQEDKQESSSSSSAQIKSKKPVHHLVKIRNQQKRLMIQKHIATPKHYQMHKTLILTTMKTTPTLARVFT